MTALMVGAGALAGLAVLGALAWAVGCIFAIDRRLAVLLEQSSRLEVARADHEARLQALEAALAVD